MTSPSIVHPGSVRLRLTRRGRAVLLAIAVAPFLVWMVCTLLFGGPAAVGGQSPDASLQYVVVQPGDTLWNIALHAKPNDDPRDVIEAIRQLNGLTGTTVQPGQRIALPRS